MILALEDKFKSYQSTYNGEKSKTQETVTADLYISAQQISYDCEAYL